ncbi:hypothetical protein ES708_21940 [subsurface metagenome]
MRRPCEGQAICPCKTNRVICLARTSQGKRFLQGKRPAHPPLYEVGRTFAIAATGFWPAGSYSLTRPLTDAPDWLRIDFLGPDHSTAPPFSSWPISENVAGNAFEVVTSR